MAILPIISAMLIPGINSNINGGTSFGYDLNGNTTTDGLRGMTIGYNVLNLPSSISKSSESILYIYSASGEKLAKRMKDNSYLYYGGSMVYNNDKSLKYILFEEGMVNKSSGAYTYEYHLKDHLGNTRVTFQPYGYSTLTTQVAEYYPFGSSYLPLNPAGTNKYLYNGKEKQDDVLGSTALDEYDYGARFYDPQIGRFYTLDRYSENFQNWSPFHYANNNPIKNIDIHGDSTFVSRNDDETYYVTGGNLENKKDKGIYMFGEDGKYSKIGESITSQSFFGDDEKPVIGAIIDPNNTDGQDFLNYLAEENPGLAKYIQNATNGGNYDFKDIGMENRSSEITPEQYNYRGSITKKGEFGSARDFGNIGAGMVAGRNGLPWEAARLGFDSYQSYKSRKLTTEGQTTQMAQKIGYLLGILLGK